MEVSIRDFFEGEASLNQEMVNVILKALAQNFQSDLDYFKFKQSVMNLQKMNLDEETSIKSAFATLSTMGVSKRKILDSIDHYLRVVDKEKDKFAIALKNQITNNIEKPKLEAEKFDSMIEERQRKIEELHKEIEAIKNRQANIDVELAESEEKINKTRDEFRSVYEYFITSFGNDKILIDQNVE